MECEGHERHLTMTHDYAPHFTSIYWPYKMFCLEKNRNSMLLGHVNFDGQNHHFVRKGNKNGFISGFGHYFPDFGYLGFGSKYP